MQNLNRSLYKVEESDYLNVDGKDKGLEKQICNKCDMT